MSVGCTGLQDSFDNSLDPSIKRNEEKMDPVRINHLMTALLSRFQTLLSQRMFETKESDSLSFGWMHKKEFLTSNQPSASILGQVFGRENRFWITRSLIGREIP